jgi:Tol biopolymer transport system component
MSGASNIVTGDNGVRDVFMWDRQSGATVKVSQGAGGAPTVDLSDEPSVSADGRYVSFASYASNLVAGDTNGVRDVFVWDRLGGATVRVSQAPGGFTTDGASSGPSLSADGRYMAFASDASNLVPDDTNGVRDVFVWDRQGGGLARVSQAPGGLAANGSSFGPSVSADGRYVAYGSYASSIVTGDSNNGADVFVWDRQSGGTVKVSQAPGGGATNDDSYDPSVSADGRIVAYDSYASNIVPGDTNEREDVFVWNRFGTG